MEELAKDAIRPLPKKIKHHVMSMTYAPKIDAVESGDCCQTIRIGRRFAVGDEILIHGWVGKAYWTKWCWGDKVGKGCGMRVTVTKVIDIYIKDIGIGKPWDGWLNWDSPWINSLAKLDFISPPTGEALRDVLFGLNGAPDEPQEYQIIRWEVI